jgi:ParB family chromosome partitioning protein
VKTYQVSLDSISFDPANTRKHGRKNLDAIKSSLRRFGQQKPVVIDSRGIVLAGNGTLAAARELGWSEITVVKSELAGVDATAFGIADNRSAELAEWDEKLGEMLASLEAENFPLVEIGFDDADLAKLQPPEFAPGTEADQGKLDQLEAKMVCCPHCKKEFDLREHGQS